jgi:hypothetical protein
VCWSGRPNHNTNRYFVNSGTLPLMLMFTVIFLMINMMDSRVYESNLNSNNWYQSKSCLIIWKNKILCHLILFWFSAISAVQIQYVYTFSVPWLLLQSGFLVRMIYWFWCASMLPFSLILLIDFWVYTWIYCSTPKFWFMGYIDLVKNSNIIYNLVKKNNIIYKTLQNQILFMPQGR